MSNMRWMSGLLGLMMLGCSTDEGTSTPSVNDPKPDQSASSLKIPDGDGARIEGLTSTVSQPTRSELRLLSEQNKQSEAQAQDIIERFGQHLNDPQARQALQAEFKQLLPSYKANMLQLGKAKLQESRSLPVVQ